MAEKDKTAYTIQAVDKALRILELISEESGEFSLSRLSDRVGLKKSYVFRMLATFEQRDYIRKIEPSGRYRTSLSAYETGGRFLHRMDILQKAKPIMTDLAQDSGESVYLSIAGEKELLFVEMVDSPQQVRVVSLVGRRFPLSQASAGKVVLAFREKPDTLLANMQHIRADGVCVDQDDLGEGIGSLSVPIFETNGDVPGSLCIVGPSFRLTQEALEKSLIPRLEVAGLSLSTKLGFIRWPGVKSGFRTEKAC